MKGKVEELFITKADSSKRRERVESIFVDEFGIQDDKFYNKNPMRTILITSKESYQLAQKNDIEIKIGSLGENILIDINPYSMLKGQRLKIGNTLLEITQNCTLCQGLSMLNEKLPKLLKNDRGIFAKYISGDSTIRIGESVEILKS